MIARNSFTQKEPTCRSSVRAKWEFAPHKGETKTHENTQTLDIPQGARTVICQLFISKSSTRLPFPKPERCRNAGAEGKLPISLADLDRKRGEFQVFQPLQSNPGTPVWPVLTVVRLRWAEILCRCVCNSYLLRFINRCIDSINWLIMIYWFPRRMATLRVSGSSKGLG